MKKLFYILLLVPGITLGAEKGFLGVHFKNLSNAMKTALDIDYGVFITSIVEGSPAEEVGIKSGDVILEINGEKMGDGTEFSDFIDKGPGETVELTILRQGKRLKLEVKLAEKEKKKTNVKLEIENYIDKSRSSWGGGGGPMVLWIEPKIDEINTVVEAMIGRGFDKNMWLMGGGGYGSVWKNLRIGGAGGGGSQVKRGNRKAEFSLGYGGFLAEYVIPLGKLQFFLGNIIGGGAIELKMSRSGTSGLSWNDIWNNLKADSVNAEDYDISLNCDFFHYQPYMGIQYVLTPWAYLTLRGGYFLSRLGEWKEDGEPIASPPEMNISNYCASVGVTFGYFTH